jgi:hypothetical protein
LSSFPEFQDINFDSLALTCVFLSIPGFQDTKFDSLTLTLFPSIQGFQDTKFDSLTLTLFPSIQGFQDTKFDSLTLTFGSWVGIPAVPFVTLYRGDIPAAQLAGKPDYIFYFYFTKLLVRVLGQTLLFFE